MNKYTEQQKEEYRLIKWYCEVKNQQYQDSGLLWQAAINRGD